MSPPGTGWRPRVIEYPVSPAFFSSVFQLNCLLNPPVQLRLSTDPKRTDVVKHTQVMTTSAYFSTSPPALGRVAPPNSSSDDLGASEVWRHSQWRVQARERAAVVSLGREPQIRDAQKHFSPRSGQQNVSQRSLFRPLRGLTGAEETAFFPHARFAGSGECHRLADARRRLQVRFFWGEIHCYSTGKLC